MNILLGIYNTSTFKRTLNSSHSTFPFSEVISNWDQVFNWGVIPVVKLACQECSLIYFVLDDIKFPLQTKISYTCAELKYILSTPRILNKTIFILNGDELTDEQFNTWYKLNNK